MPKNPKKSIPLVRNCRGLTRQGNLGINSWENGKPHRITCIPFDLRDASIGIDNSVFLKVDSHLEEFSLDKGKKINKRNSICQYFLEIPIEVWREINDQLSATRKKAKEGGK